MRNYISLIFFITTKLLYAQNPQNLRGVVLDSDIKLGIHNVNVYLLDSLNKGTITDNEGKFELTNIPPGRHMVQFSYLGYKSITLPIFIKSGKSTYIEIELKPDINLLNQIVISANSLHKSKTLNKIAVTSARAFSIEETERYAGSLGDPARMAQNFAGVTHSGDSRNDIIIRGNSPYGLLWRIDGIDVSNPNHFGAKGSTGGPITILNNNLLTNSDFFTGSFPAEYGNAFSGVFDLKMRKGNLIQYEKTFQLGWNGIELGIEGPIQKEKSSFILAYRYADLKLFEKLNFNIGVNGVPKYQDLTIKTDFQSNNHGQFSFVFIGGLSNIKIKKGQIGQNSYEALWDIETQNNKFISFINHKIKLNKTSSLYSFISLSTDVNTLVLDSTLSNNLKFLFSSFDETDRSTSFGSIYRTKLNRKDALNFGIKGYKHSINYIDSAYIGDNKNSPEYYIFTDTKNKKLWQSQLFLQWKHNFSDNFFSAVGINYNQLYFNNSFSLEPRLGINFRLKEHEIGMGYGLVTKPLPFITYFKKEEKSNQLTNYYLEFFKSHQFSISDNITRQENFRIKLELYWQYLFDVPIESKKSYFSLINFGAEFFQDRIDNLENKGKGINYGLELTIEKFLNNNWYFLSSLSLFQSKYVASDHIWRNTQFNNTYLINILAGYEFKLRNDFLFQLNNKITHTGGRPLKEYLSNGNIDENLVFSKRSKAYFRNDLRISILKNHSNKTHELSIDLQNITNNKNEYIRHYNQKTKTEEISYQMGFLPILSYRLTF